MLTSQLISIIHAGGSVIVDARDTFVSDLRTIARAGKNSGGKLYIKHANRLLTKFCKEIASENPGNVWFDFSD